VNLNGIKGVSDIRPQRKHNMELEELKNKGSDNKERGDVWAWKGKIKKDAV